MTYRRKLAIAVLAVALLTGGGMAAVADHYDGTRHPQVSELTPTSTSEPATRTPTQEPEPTPTWTNRPRRVTPTATPTATPVPPTRTPTPEAEPTATEPRR